MYPVVTRTLDNGMTVSVSPDHQASNVHINLWVHVGSGDEDPAMTGFAHLFEHLAFQGSQSVASGEHLATIQSVGGLANATTSFDRTNYYDSVPRHAAEIALWLEADRFATLAVSDENFATQREVVKEEKRQRYDNQPYGDELELLLELNFPREHPYGHTVIGSMADLERAEITHVQDFYNRWYRPTNISLVICGDLEVEEGFALAEKYFGSWKDSDVAEETPYDSSPPAHPEWRDDRRHYRLPALAAHSGVPTMTVTRDVPHDELHLGWLTPASSARESTVIDTVLCILNEGASSRLQRDLVRTRELATTVSTADFGLLRSNSLTLIGARARDGHSLEELDEELCRHIERLADCGPTQADMQRVQVALETAFLSNVANAMTRADTFNDCIATFGDANRLNTYLDEIRTITSDDVVDVTRRWLMPEQRSRLFYRKGAL